MLILGKHFQFIDLYCNIYFYIVLYNRKTYIGKHIIGKRSPLFTRVVESLANARQLLTFQGKIPFNKARSRM